MLAGDANFRPEQLPPLPPDTTSLHVVHLNLTGFYEGIREAIAGVSNALGEDAAAQVRTFDDELHEATKNLGIDLQKDLLDTLGTTMVVYSAPSEGLLGIGTGVAIQVKDVDMLRRTLDEIGKAIASQGDGSVRIVQREYHGVAFTSCSRAATAMCRSRQRTPSIVAGWWRHESADGRRLHHADRGKIRRVETFTAVRGSLVRC